MPRDPPIPAEPSWPVHETETEYETGWYNGGYDLVEQPDGSRKRYYWASLPSAVTVVPRIEDEVVFVEQYRPTTRHHHLELPAGIVETDESLVTAARRELREETGFDAESCSLAQELWVATGVLRHDRGIVFAEGLVERDRDLDPNEFLTVRRVPIDDALGQVREQPTNGSTLQALLLAREEGFL